MNVCLGKHTYVETMGMYVCLGKHAYLETRGMYVCQRYGETYIHTQKLEVCMYVQGMYIWGNIHTWKMIGMGNIHTWKMIGMYVCLPWVPPYQGMYVCMYVCMSKHTYVETMGMYVCLGVCLGKHTLENDRYVCMSGETYIPRN